MEHLTLEDLARLVDEAPTDVEAAHLRGCSACAGELSELVEQTNALRSLPDLPVPRALRAAVEAEIGREALARGGRWRRLSGPPVRIAAGIALFMAGGMAGTFGVAPALAPAGGMDRAAAESPPSTVTEAAANLETAEAAYLQAVARYAELAEDGGGLDPLSRLVALEGIVLTTEAALREAPADPVINNFHLTAVGQREALLRQLETVAAPDEWF